MTNRPGRWTSEPGGADPRDLEGSSFAEDVDEGTLDPTAEAHTSDVQGDPGGYPHDPDPAVGLTPTEQRLRNLAQRGGSDNQQGGSDSS